MHVERLISVLVLLVGSSAAQQLGGGSFVTLGQGCVARDNAVWEIFDPGRFDLDGRGLVFTPNGRGSYRVEPGGAMLPFGSGTDVAAGDDTVTGPWPLGFVFSYPGGVGSTREVDVSSNGYVYLEAGTILHSRCCTGRNALANFLAATPCFALLGQDLTTVPPAGAGTVWFDTTITQGRRIAYFTWDDVRELGNPTVPITCQLQLRDDGRVTMLWNGAANLRHDVLVGWSAGGGQPELAAEDLSVLPIDGGDGSISLPLTLTSADVPVVGQSVTIDLDQVPATALAAVLLIGSRPQGVALDPIGLETCSLLTTADVGSIAMNLAGSIGTVSLPITHAASGIGLVAYVQAVVIAPGATALDIVLSNAGRIQVGNDVLFVPNLGIIVSAHGASSHNADPSAGFWSIEHADPNRPSIVSVQFDFAAATDPVVQRTEFDTDQPGLGDRFDGGNGTAIGCRGTYRVGSDVATGLVYAGTLGSPCDGAARTGWIGSNETVPNSYRTLEFAFSAFGHGDEFEFDVQTDGFGRAGGAMAGMVVTIRFADGSQVRGELVRIDASRAVQVF